MDHFLYKNGHLFCEELGLDELARAVGTPAYVYSRATLVRHCRNLVEAFAGYPTLPCFAVKANSNLSVLSTIFAQGLGADLVSLGELERALLAGVAPQKIIFSGVGKRDDELARALDVGIFAFNVESAYELASLARIAREKGKVARVSLRINPNIDAKTNEKIATGLYTTKFGLTEADAEPLFAFIRENARSLALVGLGCHIGSQITEVGPISDAAKRMAELAGSLASRGIALEFLDLGGGLGIRYRDEDPPSLELYADTLIKYVKPTGLALVIEPGRVIVGNTGVIVTRVIGVKRTPNRHFIVLDAAMNDLIRPSMYDSFHDIVPVAAPAAGAAPVLCDFVGPICETGDFLGKDRTVPVPKAGDLFAIRSTGAYGASMASQYNSRPRAPEVLVDGARHRIVKPREALAALWDDELAAMKGL